MAEYDGKSANQIEALKIYRDSLAQSIDFVNPYFQNFVRWYRLFCGNRPAEIDCTYSQIMLWYPYSIIDQELPVTLRSMFSNPDWLNLEATGYEYERHAKVATKWLIYQMEKVQRIQQTIIPTAQSTHLFGTGYRFYGHKYVPKETSRNREVTGLAGMIEGLEKQVSIEQQGIISGDYMNVFNVYPAPYGGLVNAADNMSESVAPYVIVMTWPEEDAIKKEGEKNNFDKGQIAEMLKAPLESKDPAGEFKDTLSKMRSGWDNFSKPEWIRKAAAKGLSVGKHRRVGWYMSPKRWIVVGEDEFVLYDGKPLFEATPLAKFVGSSNLDNWFGVGLIEPCEDLITSMIMNFNHRMDYLAGVFHPPTYLPKRLVDDCGGSLEAFDPEPYKIQTYNHKQFPQGIGSYIFHDTNDAIDQQAFVEDAQMQGYLQQIIGQYPVTSLDGNNATTTAALVSKDVARGMLRAINIENSGLHDSAWLTLKMGSKYITDDQWIRINNADGFPWQQVDKDAITDGYGVHITGAKDLQIAEITFRRMLSVAPMLLQSQQVRGQVEALRQLASKGGYENVDTIMLGEQGPTPPQIPNATGGASPAATDAGGAPTIQNEQAGMQNGAAPVGGSGEGGNILV
ncbi:MAG: hypothetical protein D4S01_01385 [Dehalococcoidia bacterium]|nr:MAG: hypothetical protein D4S01_01385 [Dehalococcoidia bacterium]